MTLALVALVVVLIVVAGIKASEHLRHPENIDPSQDARGRRPADDTLDDTSRGSDRPAGADAEDPPTEVPNRTRAQPPDRRR
jgi:hypothetical protein